MRDQIAKLMFFHGVENEELLDGLAWKFTKLTTDREMLLRERDKLREALKTAEYQTQRYKDALDKNASFEKLWEEVSNENDRLREALEKIMGLDLDEACAIANEALSKEMGK